MSIIIFAIIFFIALEADWKFGVAVIAAFFASTLLEYTPVMKKQVRSAIESGTELQMPGLPAIDGESPAVLLSE